MGKSFNLKKAQEAAARKALAETEALELTNLGFRITLKKNFKLYKEMLNI